MKNVRFAWLAGAAMSLVASSAAAQALPPILTGAPNAAAVAQRCNDVLARSGIATEADFGEAPSQMLEEWVYDCDTLKRFATDEAGKPIPQELVAQMNRARFFNVGMSDMRQLGLSEIALRLYQGPPRPTSARPLAVTGTATTLSRCPNGRRTRRASVISPAMARPITPTAGRR